MIDDILFWFVAIAMAMTPVLIVLIICYTILLIWE